MYLLDTMVISELPKRHRNPGVFAWLEDPKNSDAYISVISMGEIKRGIYLQKKEESPICEKTFPLAKIFQPDMGRQDITSNSGDCPGMGEIIGLYRQFRGG